MNTRERRSVRARTGLFICLQRRDCRIGRIEFPQQREKACHVEQCSHIVASTRLYQPATVLLHALQAFEYDLQAIATDMRDTREIDHEMNRSVVESRGQKFFKLHRYRPIDVPLRANDDDLPAGLSENWHSSIDFLKTTRLYPAHVESPFW